MQRMLIGLIGFLVVLLLVLVIVAIQKQRKAKKEGKPSEIKSFSKAYSEMFIGQTKLKFSQAMLLKLLIFVIVLGFIYAVKVTNIQFYTDRAYHSMEIDADLRYRQTGKLRNPELAFQQEIAALDYVLETIPRDEFLQLDADSGMFIVSQYLDDNNIKPAENRDTFTNRVYHRAYDYYSCRIWEHYQYIALSFLASMLVEIVLVLRKSQLEAADKHNLEFMKKIFVISGSINPNFRVALETMRKKARPKVKEKLDKIFEAINSTSVNAHDVLVKMAKEQKTISERLFFEKLDEAANNDFDKAISNLRKELKYERSDVKRRYNKKVGNINTLAQVSLLFLLMFLMFYFFIPWMKLINTVGLL